MDDLDDITLTRAAAGEKGAFRRLYDHYAPFVWRVAFRTMNGDAEAAGRITQDTFIKVHARLSGFRRQSKLSTWLYGIAWRTALDELRVIKRRRERQSPLHPHLEGGLRSDDRVDQLDIQKILAALSPQERFLLTAREVDGLTFEEMELITGQSNASLRTALSRLKKRLKETLGAEYAH